MNKLKFFKIALSFFIVSSCSTLDNNQKYKEQNILLEETEVIQIKLSGESAEKRAELSGLCWYGDRLILLPQYPNIFNSDFGKIFYIDRNEITNYLSSSDPPPINVNYFTIDLSDFEDFFGFGSGFEAVTTIKDTAFFTIESLNQGDTESILVKGIIDTVNNKILLDRSTVSKDPINLFIHNISDESILTYQDKIIPIYEVYGRNKNKNPHVSLFNSNLINVGNIKFPNIEYRITDVTNVDKDGKFWAINYFFPGDLNKLNPEKDSLIINFGIGLSHSKAKTIERLVEFQIKNNGISLINKKPIYLRLQDNQSRNWEGISRFDNGFLVVTDTFPETIFAFIKPK